MISNRVFVHLIDIPESLYIAKRIVNRLFTSNLIKNSRIDLYCHYNENSFRWLPSHSNLFVHFPSVKQTSFELSTLSEMKKECDNSTEKFNVLYLHHKGATQPTNSCVSDWREYMLHFCVDKWFECTEKLTEYDAVGVNYRKEPYPHFSGNFWWSTSEYIKKLPNIKIPAGFMREQSQFNFSHYPDLAYSYRFDAEFWLGLSNPNVHCFHESGVNHYRDKYLKEKYDK